jgi:hypothetical protein
MCIGGCGACCFAADVTNCFTERKGNKCIKNAKQSIYIQIESSAPFCLILSSYFSGPWLSDASL